MTISQTQAEGAGGPEEGAGDIMKKLGNGLRKCAVMWLGLALLPCLSAAQTNAASAKPLTLEQALEYALEHYPAVRASLEQVNAARSGVSLARTQYLPQLNGIFQDSRATQNQVPGIWLPTPITPTVEGPINPSSEQSYWGSQIAALFSWEPVDFGLRSARVGQARFAEDKSQADLALTKLQVATAVGNYFLLATADHEGVVAAQANVTRWETFNKSIHVLVENELRPGVDASRADAELARARTQFYQAQQAEKAALDTLAALMGRAGGEITLESGQLSETPASASLPEVAAALHPLARDQLAGVHEFQAEEKTVQKSDYPRLFLQAEAFGRGSNIPNNGAIIGNGNGLAPGRGDWVAGVTVLFPDVLSFKARSTEEKITEAKERSQQARYDQTIQDLTGQTQAARDQLKTAELVAQQTPTELEAARQSETQSRVRYQSGLATIVEVAEAENLLAQAETDDAVARIGVWRALFGLAYAQGDLQNFLQLLRGETPGGH
jgi:outer membrane protein